MIIAKDKAVTVNYTLTNEEGEVLESSKERAPLTYIQGSGMISGFENALEGRSPKDAFSFTVKPEEAYGERRPELLFLVKKEQFRELPEISVGMALRVRAPDGAMVATIARIEEDKVLLDGNHPLAGMTLSFDVEVLDVRDATTDELAEAHQETCGCGASSCGSTCGEGCGS
ncbi:MAG: peptidylprolyl isomerase [Syntrophorhabdales bacterium]|jgi:FKBP-type peptidyl-prolyl cis-trans isomerase SlyD